MTSFFSVAQASPAGGHENDACAPLLRRSPSDLGFRASSHRVIARGQAEACPTKSQIQKRRQDAGATKERRRRFLVSRTQAPGNLRHRQECLCYLTPSSNFTFSKGAPQ
jgi:hypothetical protein